MSDDLRAQLDRLVSTVEQRREIIEEQRERIATLEAESRMGGGGTETEDSPALVDRRDALKAGGLFALLVCGIGTASADPQGRVGTGSDPLRTLYAEELNGGVTGDTPVTALDGNGLSVSGGLAGGAGVEAMDGTTIDIAQSQITSSVDDSDGTINQFDNYDGNLAPL